ncbi:hypothetical protein T11_5365 [Trichinella zimbabwensis]|uniref:Uncharacterized protein n=1 Tax=Trichinella zimbabwensis TaxID=268475 RepID=A0A0V1HKJ0_9BILA|nr:hypothetical protein T11_5365 [Trichinella zimbabwensis]
MKVKNRKSRHIEIFDITSNPTQKCTTPNLRTMKQKSGLAQRKFFFDFQRCCIMIAIEISFTSRVLENVSCFFPTLVKFNADYSATVCSVSLSSVPG